MLEPGSHRFRFRFTRSMASVDGGVMLALAAWYLLPAFVSYT
jgi:hypothetical protein